jgi:CspA family cold shock protein
MNNGTIKFFSARKGFGFVAADEGGKEVFLPATALGEIKAAELVPGQRVAFKTVPDAKGPKVTELRLLERTAPATMAAVPRATVYCDPSSEASEDVLDAIGKAGVSAEVQDITTTPLSQDRLKRLSLLLGEAGQSLVRRSDSLFLALQLDDRFIGEADFWTGIIEHPSLINTPILVLSGKARICKSAKEAKAFIEGGGNGLEKPKGLSPRLAALLRGEQPPPRKTPDKAEDTAQKQAQTEAREGQSAPRAAKKVVKKVVPKPARGKEVASTKKPKSTPPVAKKKKAASVSKSPARKAATKKSVKRPKK